MSSYTSTNSFHPVNHLSIYTHRADATLETRDDTDIRDPADKPLFWEVRRAIGRVATGGGVLPYSP